MFYRVLGYHTEKNVSMGMTVHGKHYFEVYSHKIQYCE